MVARVACESQDLRSSFPRRPTAGDIGLTGSPWHGMGLTASEAVRLLFHRIAVDQAFPLELKVPNAQTLEAMAEVDEMVNTRAARFASADEVFTELEEASGQ